MTKGFYNTPRKICNLLNVDFVNFFNQKSKIKSVLGNFFEKSINLFLVVEIQIIFLLLFCKRTECW